MIEPVRCYRASSTLQLLQQLVAQPRSAPELAELVGIAVPTVRRILRPLVEAEYVEFVPGDYRHRGHVGDRRHRYRIAARGRRLGSRMTAPWWAPDAN